MYRTIIIGIDGSDASMRALKAGCGLASAETAVWLVHTPMPDTVAFATGAVAGYHMVTMMAETDEVKEATQKIVDDATHVAAEAGVTVAGHEVRRGDPGDEILAVAKEKDADLIVTGRRGLGNITGLLIGSTSQRINHLADCAVLTVP